MGRYSSAEDFEAALEDATEELNNKVFELAQEVDQMKLEIAHAEEEIDRLEWDIKNRDIELIEYEGLYEWLQTCHHEILTTWEVTRRLEK